MGLSEVRRDRGLYEDENSLCNSALATGGRLWRAATQAKHRETAEPFRRDVLRHLDRLGLVSLVGVGHRPNREGVWWFARDVWPLVKREVPQGALRVVGRDTNESATLGPDIEALGWLEDSSEEIASWCAMIVPVRFGGGTRVKIAEGFARKCPIVATTLGAFGYGATHGEEILLADSPHDFAAACIALLRNPEMGKALSEKAHNLFVQRWTWNSFESSIERVLCECLEGNSVVTGKSQDDFGAYPHV